MAKIELGLLFTNLAVLVNVKTFILKLLALLFFQSRFFGHLADRNLVENSTPWSEQYRTYKSAHASEHMDIACASSIMEPYLIEPAVPDDP